MGAPLDLPPPLLVPATPAIVRPAEHSLLRGPSILDIVSRPERRAIFAELVARGRLTREQARQALVIGYSRPPAGSKFTVVGTNTGSGASISISGISPGSLAAGDLCIVWNQATSSSSVTPVTPSGFTQVGSVSAGAGPYNVSRVSAKKLTGSETTVTGMSATGQRWAVLVLRLSGGFSGFTANAVDSTSTNANPSAITIAASGATAPIVLFGYMTSWSSGSPGSISGKSISPNDMTEIANTALAHYLAYDQGATPADHSYDMGDSGDQNTLLGGYLSFS